MSQYGVTFAQQLLAHGRYTEALEEAARHLAREPDNPEPYFDRARAASALQRYPEAVADLARAIELDQEERVLPDAEVDDSLFETLIAWAQSQKEPREQLATLDRYRALLPGGTHREEEAEWRQRFQGTLKTTWVKPR